jgi:hypothetical protein
VALALAQGMGILIYMILWLVLPGDENHGLSGEDSLRANLNDMAAQLRSISRQVGASEKASILLAIVLMGFGGMILLDNLNIHWIHPGMIWPLVLIALGGYLVARR